jgi:hypothetical protein
MSPTPWPHLVLGWFDGLVALLILLAIIDAFRMTLGT